MKTVKIILVGLLCFALGCSVSYKILYVSFASAAAAATTTAETAKTAETGTSKHVSSAVEKKAEEVQTYIDKYFIGEYDETALCDGVAEGMIDATGDRWSYYISAEDVSSYTDSMSNSYSGIGVTIEVQEDGSVAVVSVIEGGPASAGGVCAGDIIRCVNGESTDGLESSDIVAMVRYAESDPVALTVERDGELLELDLYREVIEVAVAEYELLNGHIGYITVENFDDRCAEETIACIEQAIADGADSLLFDLRFNPGGKRAELVEVLDYLLPEGPLFRAVDYAGRESVDVSDASCVSLPMVVLINEDTYSAAEFFAAALQEYDAAEIVGVQTCGKGYFQCSYTLSDGSILNLSSGAYYTPNGVSLIDVGVTPDYEVDLIDEDYYKLYYGALEQDDDLQLKLAIQILEQ